jgi:hypothetical protein
MRVEEAAGFIVGFNERFRGYLLFFLIIPVGASADYVITASHIESKGESVSLVRAYVDMDECMTAVKGLLEANSRSTAGFWEISESAPEGTVDRAYFFHADRGLNCIPIPSDEVLIRTPVDPE